MKKESKILTLDEAEDRLLDILASHLATLPPEEADKRIEEIHRLTLDSEDRDTGSKSEEPPSTSQNPLLRRKRSAAS